MSRRRRGRPRNRKYYYEGEELPRLRLSAGVKRGIMIVFFFLLGFVTLLAFFEAAGSLGDIASKILKLLLGWGAVTAPLIFFAVAFALLLAGRKEDEQEPAASNLRVYLGAMLFVFGFGGILHLIAMRQDPGMSFELVKNGVGGGYLGLLLAYPLFAIADFWVSVLIMAGLVIVSLVLVFNINLPTLFKRNPEPKRTAEEKKDDGEIKINKMSASGFQTTEVTEDHPVPDEKNPSVGAISVMPAGTNQKALDAEISHASRFRKTNWQLPPLSLLEDSHTAIDSGNIEANVVIIRKTLADFGIEVEMGEVNVGPTVTQYTLRPATGIKLSQILTLQNDLALALSAPSVRIEAPIPGRPLVGIEVPNKATAIVRLKDIVQSESFIGHKSSLAFALGRDVAGAAMVEDLAKMPHLLIAGATGTGKSIAINSLLTSFLYRNSPEELRLIVIDPKRVELNLYNGIPHLLTPVVVDHDKAVNALKWAVNEMDRRYKLLAENGKRNILEYNAKAPDKLPYIVIIVDELADLMAVAQADVETAVVRLAQMARAVGVHLVVATQRPSVDIITGLIKANITARMAFAVASQVDSRTILDLSGAEKLLGSGDMLYITSELGKPRRIQGTYISEKEVRNVTEFIREQAGTVIYAKEILEKQRVTSSSLRFAGDEGDDEMLPEAIKLVREAGRASASLLQRRLRLGYARSARLLDLMEEKGIIGPGDGAKPREVYLDTDNPDNNEW